ncbi:MAG: choice-of-anchor Q domain-containing protein, partial [Planctomycetota bacterium]
MRCEPLEDRRLLAVFTVTNGLDASVTAPGDLPGSLRQAIFDANQLPGPDEIQFTASLRGETISLQNELVILDSLVIDAASLGTRLTLDSQQQSRVLRFAPQEGDLTLRGLNITGGFVADAGAVTDSGAGIFFESKGTLAIEDAVIRQNTAHELGGGIAAIQLTSTIALSNVQVESNESLNRSGGGIYSGGTVTINDSVLHSNHAAVSGGGVLARTLTADRSTFSGNTGGTRGGGLQVGSHLQLNTSSVINNQSGDQGGGVDALGTASIVSSTISGNRSGVSGGGVMAFEELSIIDSTIVRNSVRDPDAAGGGIYVLYAPVSIMNSIVASNSATTTRPDVALPAAATLKHSLIGDNTGTLFIEAQTPDANGNLIGAASGAGVVFAKLAPLRNHGGLTWTHALLPTSPAIDMGASVLSSDQRGGPFARDDGNGVDMGAVEMQVLPPDSFVVTSTEDELDASDLGVTLREAISAANGSSGHDEITVLPSLAGETVHLTLGALELEESVSINAFALTENLVIDARSNSGVIESTEPIDVDLAGLSITGGTASGVRLSGFGYPERTTLTLVRCFFYENLSQRDGGAVYAHGDVDMTDTIIQGNSAAENGGGVAAFFGDLRVNRSVISGNTANRHGGGLYATGRYGVPLGGGRVFLSESLVTENHARSGGGLWAFQKNLRGTGLSNTEIFDSTISNNRAEEIAGMLSLYSVTMENSTVSGNDAFGSGSGVVGGVFTVAKVFISGSTITGNQGAHVGGVSARGSYGTRYSGTDRGIIEDSIIAANGVTGDSDYRDLLGSYVGIEVRHSLIGDNHGTNLVESQVPDEHGNLIGSESGQGLIDPQLGLLLDHGGLTPTHALLPGSPAIDGGDPRVEFNSSEFDQRGAPFVRVAGGRLDMGAFEWQLPTSNCDFNGDSVCDGVDLDQLQANLVDGPLDPTRFDLTGDGEVTIADRNQWLIQAGALNLPSGNPYLLGDANLDGRVDGQDYIEWSLHKFTNDSAWTSGDFNADGLVDGRDFIVWNGSKFQSADQWPIARPSDAHLTYFDQGDEDEKPPSPR